MFTKCFSQVWFGLGLATVFAFGQSTLASTIIGFADAQGFSVKLDVSTPPGGSLGGANANLTASGVITADFPPSPPSYPFGNVDSYKNQSPITSAYGLGMVSLFVNGQNQAAFSSNLGVANGIVELTPPGFVSPPGPASSSAVDFKITDPFDPLQTNLRITFDSLRSLAIVSVHNNLLVPVGDVTFGAGAIQIGSSTFPFAPFSNAYPPNNGPPPELVITDQQLGGQGLVGGRIVATTRVSGNGPSDTGAGIFFEAVHLSFQNFSVPTTIGTRSTINGALILGVTVASLQVVDGFGTPFTDSGNSLLLPNGQQAPLPFGQTGTGNPIPEPSSLAIIAVAGLTGVIARARSPKRAVGGRGSCGRDWGG